MVEVFVEGMNQVSEFLTPLKKDKNTFSDRDLTLVRLMQRSSFPVDNMQLQNMLSAKGKKQRKVAKIIIQDLLNRRKIDKNSYVHLHQLIEDHEMTAFKTSLTALSALDLLCDSHSNLGQKLSNQSREELLMGLRAMTKFQPLEPKTEEKLIELASSNASLRGPSFSPFHAVAHLQNQLSRAGARRLKIDEATFRLFVNSKAVKLQGNRIVECASSTKSEDEILVNAMISHLEENPTADEMTAANLLLGKLVTKYQKEIDQGLSANRDDSLMMRLSYLDRLVVSQYTKENAIDLSGTDSLYRTQIARDELVKWQKQTICRGNSKGTDEKLMSQRDATLSFVYQPKQVQLLKNLLLHKYASTFNHCWNSDDRGVLTIRLNGQNSPVTDLENLKLRVVQGGRFMSAVDGQEYFYRYDEGFAPVKIENHSTEWQGELPLFKMSEEPQDGWSFEVRTDIGGGETHAWIRLYTPDGKVFSAGQFWDRDLEIANIKRMVSLAGYVRAGDLHEYMGSEKRTKVVRYSITEEQFKTAKKAIEESQNCDWNLINQNCSTWVRKIAEKINIHVNSQTTPLFYALPIPAFIRRFYNRFPKIHYITRLPTWPFSILTNLLIILLGGRKIHPLAKKSERRVFPSISQILCPYGAKVDDPQEIAYWQEREPSFQGHRD